MLKFYILLTLAVAGSVYGQEANSEAAPEPYAYAYETDSHAASEQREPNGKVSGFYTLTDADGRARRVEYYADESGFHAKVQTNEVGTKSENSADVEVQASPPTAEQQVYQTSSYQAAAPVTTVQQQRYVYQQNAVAQPYRSVQYVQQPGYVYSAGSPGYVVGAPGYTASYTGQKYGYGAVSGVAPAVVSGVYNAAGYNAAGYNAAGYNPAGYNAAGYNAAGLNAAGYNSGAYNSGTRYATTTTTGVVPATTYGVVNGATTYGVGQGVSTYGVGNYNYHTPSSYYARYSSSSVQPASSYGAVSGSRYVSSSVAGVPTVYSAGLPASVSYSAGVAPVASFSAGVSPVASVSAPGVSAGLGSSNYLVLKKRETEK